MKPITLTILYILVSGFSFNSFAAEEKWYSVELIVFQQGSKQSAEEEIWPFIENIQIDPRSVDLLPAETTRASRIDAPIPLPTPFSKTPAQSLKLTDTAQKLAGDNNYKVLVHTGWRQPVVANSAGNPVLINDEDSIRAYQELAPVPEQSADATPEKTPEENLLAELVKEIETTQVNPEDFPGYRVFPHMEENDNINSKWALRQTTTPVGELPERFQPRNPVGPPELHVYGTVKLKLGRFLHLEVDLFERPTFKSTITDQNQTEFPMQMTIDTQNSSEGKDPSTNKKLLQMAGFESHTQEFQLKDSRRIQTQQIYYFDHPMFGVIALVKDYEPDADNI